jgi:serine/threonine protein kinase
MEASGQGPDDQQSLEIAQRWCENKGPSWKVLDKAGRGGTAPVYSVLSDEGEFALKIYDQEYSLGATGEIEELRVKKQVTLGRHDCPSLIQVFDGGRFEDRLFVLMNRAPGRELEKVLGEVPRNKIRWIVDQVARAVTFLRTHDLCHRDIKSANIFVSDDFTRVTLLDLSVTRDIYDPVGLGTDYGGQLPVVATARYAPPEYLFRLLDPGKSLWHALDIYQLGALLYDLIAREPLFQREFLACKNNRYRFAWTVAVIQPELSANDVDADLIFLARRALDKDWKRRQSLQVDDFLEDAPARGKRALEMIGLGVKADTSSQSRSGALGAMRLQLRTVASELEEKLREFLQTLGVRSKHSANQGPTDLSREVVLSWETKNTDELTGPIRTEFRVLLTLAELPQGRVVESKAALKASDSKGTRSAIIELPSLPDSTDVSIQMVAQCEEVLPKLAELIAQMPARGE